MPPEDEEHTTAWDVVQRERARIAACLEERCLQQRVTIGGNPFECKLNEGHIGDCSALPGTVSVTLERMREILNG